MNNARRIYLTLNLALIWFAAILVCDAVGLGELSFRYGGLIMLALVMSSVTAFELFKRN